MQERISLLNATLRYVFILNEKKVCLNKQFSLEEPHYYEERVSVMPKRSLNLHENKVWRRK